MRLQVLTLGVLVLLVPYAYAITSETDDDTLIDPLYGVEKALSLSPKDIFYPTATTTPLSTELRKDGGSIDNSIDNMTFSDVTWVSSHNSHANKFASAENVLRQIASNQEYSVYEQLSRGVRALMLDIEYRNGALYCVHSFVEFSLLRDLVLNEIVPFLDEDEQSIITIDFETTGDVELIRSELRILLEQVPELARRIFRVNDRLWVRSLSLY